MHINYTGTIHSGSEPFQRKSASTHKAFQNPMVHMDGVLHDTTRESVNAIADTNSAFSGCCPAPRAQLLFITGSLNAVSDSISQVYGVLEHLDTVCFSCDPIEGKKHV